MDLFPIILPNVNFLRFDYDDASIASPLFNLPLAYGKRFENCHNEGDLHANVPCRLLLYGENEFLLSSFFDDKAKYSCLNNNGSIAETLTPFWAKDKPVLMKNEAILTCFASIPGRFLFLLLIDTQDIIVFLHDGYDR